MPRATIISTKSPETWCNTAAEALSVGTPVVAYDFGHVPRLVGPAGAMVPWSTDGLGTAPRHLWTAAGELLSDSERYHSAAGAGPRQVAAHTPTASAAVFLNAAG